MALVVGGTDYVQMPNGTTAQRPTSPAAGMTRFNSTTGLLEYYNGTTWVTTGGAGFFAVLVEVGWALAAVPISRSVAPRRAASRSVAPPRRGGRWDEELAGMGGARRGLGGE